MVQIDFTSLKEQLSPSDICRILGEYGVAPRKDTINYIVFPTCCHNLVGGSSKLYYYKDSRSFHCYTECNDNFDITDDMINNMYNFSNQLSKQVSIMLEHNKGKELNDKELQDMLMRIYNSTVK